MLRNIELAAHFRLPPFPPSTLVLSLVIINLVIACRSANMMLFLFFAFIYGSLMLYRVHNVQIYLKITIMANAVVLWAYLNGVVITRSEENFVFYAFVIIFSKKLVLAAIGVFKALCCFKPVEFDDVFWVIQFGSYADFVKYFCEIKLMRLVPSGLRIIQNLRVGNRSAYISAIRFGLHFSRELITTGTTQWMVLSVIIGLWEIYNNYVNQFGMARVFEKNGVCMYPRSFLIFGFIVVSISQFAWVFAGPFAPVWTIVRKIIWNFLRI